MRMIRWEPFRDLDHVFDHFFADAYRRFPREAGDPAANGWAPLADVSETAGEYLIKAELPEVRKEDVKVTIEDGVITISGERKYEKEHKDEKTHRMESFYGQFSRSFSVPENVDVEAIRAEAKDGILKVRLPKRTPDRPKSMQVEVS